MVIITPPPPDDNNIAIKEYKGDGDFRNGESIALLKEADIVITNPPFSLFREYIAQLVEYKKKFLIVGSMNALTYKETFQLFQQNKMWVGYKKMGADMLFDVSAEFAKELVATKKENSGYKIIDGVIKGRAPAIWFTNLSHKKRHKKLILVEEYKKKSSSYPTYDNFKIIEVAKVKNIPTDYEGVMGVPITFLDKYNPNQFEILGIANSARWIGHECITKIKGKGIYNRILIRNKDLQKGVKT